MWLFLVRIWILVLFSVLEEREGYHRNFIYMKRRITGLLAGNNRTIMNVALNGSIPFLTQGPVRKANY